MNPATAYDERESAASYRVDPDGTVTEVLAAGLGTDIQYLGRLRVIRATL